MDSVRWTQEHSSQELQFIYLFSFCFHRFSSGFVFNYVKLAQFITCMRVCTVTFAKSFNQTKFLFALLLSLLNMQTNPELVLEASHYHSIRPLLHRTTSTVLLRLHGHQNATCDLFNEDRFYLCLNLFVSNIELKQWALLPYLAAVLKKARKCLGGKWTFAFGIYVGSPGTEPLVVSIRHVASFRKGGKTQQEVILRDLPKSSQQTSMESEEQSLRSSKEASVSSWTWNLSERKKQQQTSHSCV